MSKINAFKHAKTTAMLMANVRRTTTAIAAKKHAQSRLTQAIFEVLRRNKATWHNSAVDSSSNSVTLLLQ